MSINIKSYIKAVPETDVDRESPMLIMEQPGEQEELEGFDDSKIIDLLHVN